MEVQCLNYLKICSKFHSHLLSSLLPVKARLWINRISLKLNLYCKEYRCLSHDDKEKLLKESQEMLDVPIDNRFHPLRDQTSFQTLISAAKEINGRYKDSTIVSLGTIAGVSH